MIMPLKNGKSKKWLFNRKYMLNSLRMLSDITKDLENHLNDDADLFDRLEVIKTVIRKYGEEKCYVSFSGGKDSTVLSHLIDLALPSNKIPRVYCDTGIELNIIKNFVKDIAKQDDRIVIIKPKLPIKKMLEKEGYPFKSKHHSEMWQIWANNHDAMIEETKEIVRICFPWVTDEIMKSVKEYYRWRK